MRWCDRFWYPVTSELIASSISSPYWLLQSPFITVLIALSPFNTTKQRKVIYLPDKAWKLIYEENKDNIFIYLISLICWRVLFPFPKQTKDGRVGGTVVRAPVIHQWDSRLRPIRGLSLLVLLSTPKVSPGFPDLSPSLKIFPCSMYNYIACSSSDVSPRA